MVNYSIVVPVFNEEESLEALIREVTEHMGNLAKPYEIVFVNDGSTDRSLEIMEDAKRRLGDKINIVNLPQRKGQTFALSSGLCAAKGDIAITLDADLQNDPADIEKLLIKMNEGYDVVCGWRKARMDRPLKMALSKFGNVLQRMFTGMKIHDVSCTLRAYRKECIGKLKLTWEGQHRFIPLILSKKGFKVGEIVSHHRQRKYGYSKYSHRRVFKVVADFFKIIFTKG